MSEIEEMLLEPNYRDYLGKKWDLLERLVGRKEMKIINNDLPQTMCIENFWIKEWLDNQDVRSAALTKKLKAMSHEEFISYLNKREESCT